MGQVFYILRNDQWFTLWDGATAVTQLFARQAEAVVPIAGRPSGVVPQRNGEYEIDLPVFTAFVGALVRRYRSSTHAVLRTLIESVAAVGIVMVERAGEEIVELAEPAVPMDMSSVSVGVGGFAPTGDVRRLRERADEVERAMPR
jgi:hypothetical protein